MTVLSVWPDRRLFASVLCLARVSFGVAGGPVIVLTAESFLCAAAFAFLLMFTAPFIFGMAAVHSAAGYIMSRFLIGWSLAGFVTCQFWTSIMFSPNVVGFANALAGGWGNAGQSPSHAAIQNTVALLASCNESCSCA